MSHIDLILTRRSVLAKEMCDPGPDSEQLQQILAAGHRVPDHGKLGPWRFVVFQDSARAAFGLELADIYQKQYPDASESQLDFQASLLTRAPTVIAVISTAGEHIKIPEWEQVLSAGAACQNMLMAASALGFGAQWLTEWTTYDKDVHKLLGMNATDKIAGFIYIGSFKDKPSERNRPSLEERVSYWSA